MPLNHLKDGSDLVNREKVESSLQSSSKQEGSEYKGQKEVLGLNPKDTKCCFLGQ